MVRAFLAIPLGEQTKSSLATLQKQLKAAAGDVRWGRPENLHLTLHFFGDTSQENLEKIKASMLSVRRCHKPFDIDIIGLGGFPSVSRSRVIWLGLEPQTALKQLHRDLQRAFQDAGLATDKRPYSPHLTIGRARRKVVNLTEASVTLSDTSIGHLRVDRMVLYESRLQKSGAEHIPLLTVNFDEETDNLS